MQKSVKELQKIKIMEMLNYYIEQGHRNRIGQCGQVVRAGLLGLVNWGSLVVNRINRVKFLLAGPLSARSVNSKTMDLIQLSKTVREVCLDIQLEELVKLVSQVVKFGWRLILL